MHTTLKNVELLKHFKISKTAQHVSVYKETIISRYLAKIKHLVISGYVELVQDVVSVMAAYCDLTTSCTRSTYPLVTKCVILAKY